MIYENVARFAFNDCNKYGDPWGIAAQEKHQAFCSIDRINEAHQIMSRIYVGLILRMKSEEKILHEFEKNNFKCKNQKEFNTQIELTYNVIEKFSRQ